MTGTSTASVRTRSVIAEILRVHVVDQPTAVGQRGDDADVMAADDIAWIPAQTNGGVLHRAHQPAVHEEGDRSIVGSVGGSTAVSSRVAPLTIVSAAAR